MKKEIIDIIKEKVEFGKNIPTVLLQYNFELPKHKEVKKDSFFGVKAKFNQDVKEGNVQVTYTM